MHRTPLSCFYCDFPIQVVGDNTKGAAVSGAREYLWRVRLFSRCGC
jgi:hypothetical protein